MTEEDGMTNNDSANEVDCPWFDDEWLREHPEFPLNTALISNDGAGSAVPTQAAA
jgi:hypothetical protein